MFVAAIIFAILAAVALVAAALVKRRLAAARAALDTQKATANPNSYDGAQTARRLQDHVNAARAAKTATTGGLSLFTGLSVVFTALSCLFTQDVGQSFVLKDWTGNLVGERTASGLGVKAPWVDAIEFDTRNQLVAYIGDGSSTYNGQKATGPQITATDKEGVHADLDVAVVYSINPASVRDIYTQYRTQEAFRATLIEQDVRSVVRDVPAQYGTLDLLNSREQAAQRIKDALTKRWAPLGVVVENVALQEIRYSNQVKSRFDAAQQARIDVTKAQADLEAAKVTAQEKVVQAQAEADANNKLAASLTDPILKQRYLDTLGKLAQSGNLVITDGTGGQIVNLPSKK